MQECIKVEATHTVEVKILFLSKIKMTSVKEYNGWLDKNLYLNLQFPQTWCLIGWLGK